MLSLLLKISNQLDKAKGKAHAVATAFAKATAVDEGYDMQRRLRLSRRRKMITSSQEFSPDASMTLKNYDYVFLS